ncbi:MAG: phosphatidate cytidylyltransferase [Dysgonamonadaceae bacterium]|jgi:phosphatidate cytidylyltransferase|nr:phosphatidate cytidylyltransferase [Dysgonamonadaceae bacterium]
MKNLLLRTLTGILYVALITGSILLNQYTFLFLFSVAVFLCLQEFYRLINVYKKIKINVGYNSIGGVLLFVATYLYTSGTFSFAVVVVYLFYLAVLLISSLYIKHSDTVAYLAYTFLGQCYVALPFSLLNLLVFPNHSPEGVYYHSFLLSLFVFIWVNDTGAYAVGMLFGKHRLFPRISPKKSWEGFFGGLILTVASAFVFARFNTGISFYHWINISFFVVLFGTWGDLIESLLKRTLGIKDSGNALPGHGGFLDRFDSMLLAVYGALLYVQLIQN